jgi:hypothetical protein
MFKIPTKLEQKDCSKGQDHSAHPYGGRLVPSRFFRSSGCHTKHENTTKLPQIRQNGDCPIILFLLCASRSGSTNKRTTLKYYCGFALRPAERKYDMAQISRMMPILLTVDTYNPFFIFKSLYHLM